MELSDYKGVWVFTEQHDGALLSVAGELLGEGRKLADARGVELAAVLIGSEVGQLADELFTLGADKVYLADNPKLEKYTSDAYSIVMHDAISKHKPEIVLMGATHNGRDLAPTVAAMLETGLTADCTQLSIGDDGNLIQTRPAFGGKLMARIVCKDNRPQMATVRPGVMDKPKADATRTGEVVPLAVNVTDAAMRIKVLKQDRKASTEIPLTEAKVIVSGGLGMEGVEGFSMLRQLASLFTQSTIGASRGAVDAGWISSNYQVGQTGVTVKPDIYFACGISGAIQHLAGMKDAKYIIAINKDPRAPIFDAADVGIVGDVHDVIPKIIEEIKAIQKKQRELAS